MFFQKSERQIVEVSVQETMTVQISHAQNAHP